MMYCYVFCYRLTNEIRCVRITAVMQFLSSLRRFTKKKKDSLMSQKEVIRRREGREQIERLVQRGLSIPVALL